MEATNLLVIFYIMYAFLPSPFVSYKDISLFRKYELFELFVIYT